MTYYSSTTRVTLLLLHHAHQLTTPRPRAYKHPTELTKAPVLLPARLSGTVLLYFLCELFDKIFQLTEITYAYKLPVSGWHIWTTVSDVITCIWAVGTVVS